MNVIQFSSGIQSNKTYAFHIKKEQQLIKINDYYLNNNTRISTHKIKIINKKHFKIDLLLFFKCNATPKSNFFVTKKN